MINQIFNGDALSELKKLSDKSIDCCVTSPPYFRLRDYEMDNQIGLEKTPQEYVERIVSVFSEVRRVLKDNGTLWINLGDSYNGSGKGGNEEMYQKKKLKKARNGKSTELNNLKQKDLIGIPWRVAFALQEDGWYLRQDIIWHKLNPMPESVSDRCTKSHEYIFLLSKTKKYFFDANAIKEPCVWDTGGLTEMRSNRAEFFHKAMPTAMKNGIRPKKKGPQTFGGEKARIRQQNGGDLRNGNRSDKNSQWGKMWDSESPTRNKRSVWSIATAPFKDSHFAVFPPDLIKPCILAGCPKQGIVLDPFMGAGTTALVARQYNRNYIGIELNPQYVEIAKRRLESSLGFFS